MDIGIIGGADGPTSILVSGSTSGPGIAPILLGAALVLLAVGLIVYGVRHKQLSPNSDRPHRHHR